MTDTNFIKLIAVLSCIFTGFMGLYQIATLPVLLLAMVWWTIVGLLSTSNTMKSSLSYPVILLGFAPLYWYHTPPFLISMMAASLGVLYFKKVLIDAHYLAWRSNFKTALGFMVGVVLFRFFVPYQATALVELGQMTLIFLIASVLVIRSARNELAGMSPSKMRKNNLRNIMTVLMAIGISLTQQAYQVFQFLLELLSGLIPERLLILIHSGFTRLLDTIFKWLFSDEADISDIEDAFGLDPQTPMVADDVAQKLAEQAIHQKNGAMIHDVIQWLVGTFAVVVILVLLYLIIKKGSDKKEDSDTLLVVTEERESLKWFSAKKIVLPTYHRGPRTSNQQIRFHYQQFLKILKKANIEISSTDTSLDVLEKTQQKFVPGPSEVRDIYIASRYGDQVATKNDVDRLKKIIQAIKLQ